MRYTLMYALAAFILIVAVLQLLAYVFPETHDGQTCVNYVEKDFSIHGRNALVCTEWK